MKTFRTFKTIGLTTVMIILMSCRTEDGQDGAIGPQGPQGPQGVQGISGVDGADGTNGEDGNANVIASGWVDVTFSPITSNTIITWIIDERITQEVLDDAIFLVYTRKSTIPNNITSIPFTDAFLSISYYYALDSSVNQLQVLGVSLDGSSPRIDFLDQIRFVIVPANMDSSSLANLTYDEVVSQFGLNLGK